MDRILHCMLDGDGANDDLFGIWIVVEALRHG